MTLDAPSPEFHTSFGRVSKASGPIVRAHGKFHVGQVCSISQQSGASILAEVVGFDGDEAILTPYGTLEGISSRSKIWPVANQSEVPVADSMCGRVLNSMGVPIDDGGELGPTEFTPCERSAPNPMTRPLIDKPFATGIRAIDGALTCGEGQRVGIFAAAGGGKSTLLGMLVNNAQYDRCVIVLIGERGREVREFVEHNLGPEGMAKSVLIIATSDRPAIEQVKSAYTGTALAEYFRARGEKVLLLMDSLTRFGRAQRQIGLSAGEPPTRRGYPPSVFEKLPALVERGGLSPEGSITAFYTVLVEGDDMNEPIADETRSLLDGHIILSRELAASGHYPAIDVLASASRVLNAVVDEPHGQSINQMRELMAKYKEVELLVRLGNTHLDPIRSWTKLCGAIRKFRRSLDNEQAFPRILPKQPNGSNGLQVMNDLAQIIELRSSKLDQIKSIERQRKNAVQRAKTDLRIAQEDIQAFSDELRGMEAGLMSNLIGKHVTVNDMTMVDQILEKAKRYAQELIKRANQAENVVNECIKELETIRTQRIFIHKKLKNITEVNTELLKKSQRLALIAAEAAEEEIMETVYNNGRL